jgi:uncharacterized protein (DUF1015 family)
VALLFIEEWENGSVFPHERTYSGPKADRLKLVRATGHQMSFIFSLYSDPDGETAPQIRGITGSPEITRYLDGEGVEHIFTRCTDPKIHAALSETMKDKKVFVADGHHRYETFLAFRDELDRRGVKGDGHRWAIMYFTPLEGDAITILPCHRIISAATPIDEPAVLKELGRFFTVETYDATDPDTGRFIQSLEARGKGSFGFYPGGNRYYLLTLSGSRETDRFFPADMRDEIKRLDVSILHHVIIAGIAGLTQPSIDYSHDAHRALEQGRREKSAVFLVNPTSVQEVKEASLIGGRMPQKSTYFYPKLASGLALYRMFT